MTGWGWGIKDSPKRTSGPLDGVALARLRNLPKAELSVWIDNSLVKIGQNVASAQRSSRVAEAASLLDEAEEEAAALVQALRELASR